MLKYEYRYPKCKHLSQRVPAKRGASIWGLWLLDVHRVITAIARCSLHVKFLLKERLLCAGITMLKTVDRFKK